VTVAVRSDDLRSQNRLRVLTAMRRNAVASRKDIATWTGLSPATVSAITSDYIDEAVLVPIQVEGGTTPGRGRPQIALTLNPEAGLVCAVYVRLNEISAVIVDYAGQTKGDFSVHFPTLNSTTEALQGALFNCIKSALKRTSSSTSDLLRIAVGFQGVVDASGSSVLWTPICHEKDIAVCQWLEEHFSVPARVSNDCDLIAQALNSNDHEKYGQHFGAVLLDNGVGMGLYLREDIVNGTLSSGIEFGHMTYMPDGALCRCGNRGCIEAYAGDYAISRRAKGEPGDTPPTDVLDAPDLERILAAASDGDADALAAIEAAGAAIGTGLASLYALLDRFPIVLVGRGTLFFKLMEPAIRAALSAVPGQDARQPLDIDCFLEVSSLVHGGGAISALHLHDLEISGQRIPVGVPS